MPHPGTLFICAAEDGGDRGGCFLMPEEVGGLKATEKERGRKRKQRLDMGKERETLENRVGGSLQMR